MTIGQLAQAAGVGVETIRFYERRGLIVRPPRPTSGYRTYPRETVTRILFIRRAKELGFSLREIDTLLSLKVRGGANCGRVERRANAKIEEIDGKIADLRRMKRSLARLVDACRSRTSTDDCPILDTLERRRSG